MLQFIVDTFKKISEKKVVSKIDSDERVGEKSKKQSQVIFSIDGMHCVSCSLNIDIALEDVDGVLEAKTSYAKSKTSVSFDPTKTAISELKKIIEGAGYTVIAP